jgi:hypothetical protein
LPASEDLFTTIHKGLRSLLYDLSRRTQTTDFADLAATQALVNDFETDFAIARSAGCALCTMSTHAHHEESVVFPESARHGNALITLLIQEHQDLTRRELALARAGREILAMPTPVARISAGVELNQGANDLVVAYLNHMNREERDLVPLMAEHFSDEQMARMRGAIIALFPPDRLMALLAWMLPSLNVNELSDLLASVRPTVPPPVFQAVTDLCSAKVEPARWAATVSRVGI